MFYSEENISVLIKCKICKLDLKNAKILPCGLYCGECVSKLERSVSKLTGYFDCLSCGKNHSVPDDGFLSWEPLNEFYENKKNIPIEEIYRGESINKLQENLKHVENKINEFDSYLTDSESLINEYCLNLRNEVQLETDIVIKKIQDMNEKFINRIDQYELKLITDLQIRRASWDNIYSFIDELVIFNSKWQYYLKKLDINDIEVEKANNQFNDFKSKFENEKLKIENLIFNHEKMVFNKKSSYSIENVLGELDLKLMSSQNINKNLDFSIVDSVDISSSSKPLNVQKVNTQKVLHSNGLNIFHKSMIIPELKINLSNYREINPNDIMIQSKALYRIDFAGCCSYPYLKNKIVYACLCDTSNISVKSIGLFILNSERIIKYRSVMQLNLKSQEKNYVLELKTFANSIILSYSKTGPNNKGYSLKILNSELETIKKKDVQVHNRSAFVTSIDANVDSICIYVYLSKRVGGTNKSNFASNIQEDEILTIFDWSLNKIGSIKENGDLLSSRIIMSPTNNLNFIGRRNNILYLLDDQRLKIIYEKDGTLITKIHMKNINKIEFDSANNFYVLLRSPRKILQFDMVGNLKTKTDIELNERFDEISINENGQFMFYGCGCGCFFYELI